MITLQALPKQGYKRATWKNGLGHTDEIAIHPEGADLRRGDFLFRLSSARVAQASPFSTFPDHDRTLVILEGEGMRLTHTFPESDGEDTAEIPPFEPYEFPGDVPSRCELLGGEVRDLSLFIRKSEAEGVTEILELDADEPYPWIPAGRWNFLFAADRALEITSPVDGRKTRIAAGDTLRVELDEPLSEETPLMIQAQGGTGRAVVVAVQG